MISHPKPTPEWRKPRFPGPRSVTLALLAAIGLVLGSACSEWDRYWDEDDPPTGPVTPTDRTPPTVSFLAPSGPDSAHATPVSGSTYPVAIQAEDSVGVAQVSLTIDGGPAVDVPGPDWTLMWDTTILDEASTHRLEATAVDAAGNTGTSGAVYAQVFNLGPEVVITSPPDSALVKGRLPIAVDFPGAAPDIEKVEFFAGIFPVGELTTPPWTYELDTRLLPTSRYVLTAKATTTLGSVGVSDPVQVYVNNGVPVAEIDFPAGDMDTVATRGILVLEGTVSDTEEDEIPIPPDQIIWRSSVDGSIGTGRETQAQYLTVGTHAITLEVTNAWGTTGYSDPIPMEVLAEGTYTFCDDIMRDIIEWSMCTFCHNPNTSEWPSMEYDLRTYSGLITGGLTTAFPIVAPGRPEASFLYNKITAETTEETWAGDPMPPDQFPPVFPFLQEKMRVWILEGAAPDDPEECN
jgi:hypothetical protein